MYRVLLADDEKLDLEGMRTFIPWQELGMEVVKGVTNGFDACRVLETEKIDILVTDVRMPNMSGLDLARRALEMNGSIRIIFISGYQDFSYVKQALSLNAVNYVLKPMDDQELIDSLVKVREALDQERERRDVYGQMGPIVKQQYLLQLLEGTIDEASLYSLQSDYGMEDVCWPVQVAVIEIDERPLDPSPADGSLEQVIAACEARGICHYAKKSSARLTILLEASEREMLPDQLVQELQTLQMPLVLTIGIGGAATDWEALERSSREALEALDLKIFYGKGQVIAYGGLQPAEQEDARQLDARLESLFLAMSGYEIVRIHDELDELFKVVRSLRSRIILRSYAMYILMRLDQYLQRTNEDVYQLLGMDLTHYDVIDQFETIQDIHRWLRSRVYEISETLHTKKQKKNWRLIQEMIDYMRERTGQTITLRELAEQFSMSPNYLGLIFKEETGKNFSDYFIQLRMERAADLMKSTHLKVYEVADQVGYRHLPYFSRQFKETFGMTPLEYRRS
ncbi:response regulator [Paenibacillus daejeonensis]|uniref:response regulator n=1 Tax=Paenibacillus daejeonensis TaxID=135193 RepID=UPI00036BA345|nr:response regulator [Paenibacillus daejeonensis]